MIARYTLASNMRNNLSNVSKKHINNLCKIHSHEFYELEYIISGSGKYIIDGTEYPIEPGMLYFMTPVNFHMVDAKDTEIYNIMFPNGACDMYYLSKLALNSKAIVLKTNDTDKAFYEAVLQELLLNKNDSAMFSLLLNALIAKLGKSVSDFKNDKLSISQKAILYIITNFRLQISLSDVADHVGFAPSYLSDMFKKQTGVGLKQYINSVRFEYARNLIMYSNLSITQICNDSGFEDYSNFIKRFKERYGMSPSKYRRNYQ